jgi:CheY-like chemotaxis protein
MTESRARRARRREDDRPLILIVDDDPDLLDLVGEVLVERGYRVALSRNGEEALDSIERDVPDLVLLDMRMPVMDGWTFARHLRERHGRSIPIVVMTAAEDSKLRADEIGADSDLGKPFDLQQLHDVVEDTLAE